MCLGQILSCSTPIHAMEDKPKRTTVACDFCRNKKIKCDGSSPCANCVQFKSESCKYSERSRKRKRHGTPTSDSLSALDSRLTRLESLLSRVADKLEPGVTKEITLRKNDSKESDEEGKITIEATSHLRHDCIPNGLLEDMPSVRAEASPGYLDSKNPSLGASPNVAPGKNGSLHDVDEKSKGPMSTKFDLYLGSHSIFSILLGNSLDHLVHFLQPKDYHVLTPLRNLPTLFHLRMARSIALLHRSTSFDPRAKPSIFDRPIPYEPELIMSLIKNHYAELPLAALICDPDHVLLLFDKYFTNKNYHFKVSELFIMLVSVCLTISCKFCQDSPTTTPGSELGSEKGVISVDEFDKLEKLKQELNYNCVLYYYRLLMWADGFETIQAFLLYVMFNELQEIAPFINFIILAVAIRHGHEQGLHRPEISDELPGKDRTQRIRVWIICLLLDMEVSFRQGKTPLNNFNDIPVRSVNLPQHNISEIPQSFYDTLLDRKYLSLNSPKDNDNFYLMALLTFTKIRARSYAELFACNVHFENFGAFIYRLGLINDEMLALADLLGSMSPRFYNEYNHGARTLGSVPQRYTFFHMNFFAHLMTINRLPFMIEDIESPEIDVSRFRNFTLNSARSILIMCHTFCSVRHNPWVDWAYWFPISAFVCLGRMCLNRPKSLETPKDIQLLVDSCKVITAFKKEINAGAFKYSSEKEMLMSLMLRLMLRLVVRSVESATNTQMIDDKTRQYLESTKKICPELFLSSEEFLKTGTSKGWEVITIKGPDLGGTHGSSVWNSPRNSPSVLNILDQPYKPDNNNNFVDYWDDALFHSMLPLQNAGQQTNLMFDNGL